MILHAKISGSFDESGLIEYEVLTGATFTETYNEELDSGSIVITHIKDRISIKPYDWVRVYDDDGKFAKTYLVDNYVERQINILEPYYEYTIELMSETKILEKIQLPNRQWQHSFNADGTEKRKKIREIIESVMKSYVPRVKIADETEQYGFKYDYLIDFSDVSDSTKAIYKRFDHDSRDISLSQPTLRQCLTALMTQVGCIPTIKDGKLGYLDLRAEPTAMTLDTASFNQVQRSASSDSFVNTLISQGENILDADNATINETVGFRDRSKVFLKQLENLYIETRYPIYKVNRLTMKAWVSSSLEGYWQSFVLSDLTSVYITQTAITTHDGSQQIMAEIGHGTQYAVTMTEQRFIIYSADAVNGKPTISRTISVADTPLPAGGNTAIVWSGPLQAGETLYAYVGKAVLQGSDEAGWVYRTVLEEDVYAKYQLTQDITPLCVEESKRQLLDTDFLTMTKANITDISDLARYYYGTVGYQIGGKTIEGWSSTYTYVMANSWWEIIGSGANQRTKTYIENITDAILYPTELQKLVFGSITTERIIAKDNYEIWVYGLENNTSVTKQANFTSWYFDIEYQPLNSLSVRYSKEEEIPIAYEQLDSPADSISSMDYLAAHETDSVNRLGNPVVSINQYADDAHWSQVRFFNGAPLRYQDSTIFQIVYSFDFNGTAVNYFGSKDFVIKNYNTAIITKYRAYQYVDYSQAITRKENEKVWVLITQKNYPNMDEKVTFGAIYSGGNAQRSKNALASPFLNGWGQPLEVGCQATVWGESTNSYKNEMSVLTYKASIALNQEEFDNASAGLRMLYDSDYDKIGGGVPQGWYMWPETAHERRSVGWMTSITATYDLTEINPSQSDLEDELEIIAGMPRIYNFTNLPYSIDSDAPNTEIVSLKDKRYDKDFGEILNQTLQFEYYNDDGTIEFGEFFADSVSWRPQSGWSRGVIADDQFYNAHWKMSETEYTYAGNAGEIIDPPYQYISVTNTNITIDWDRVDMQGIGCVRGVLFKAENGIVRIRDCYEISPDHEPDAGEQTTYHIILNDTKTQKAFVIDEETGIPYLSHEIDEL